MRTKEEVLKDQRELKKLVPMKGNVLKDVPIATASSQAATPTQVQPKGKLMPQPKPAMVAPGKQPAPAKTKGTTSPKSISVEPVKQPAPTKSRDPTTGAEWEPTLYVHITPANPRCGVPALSQRALEVMGQDPKNGDIFAFTDRWHKTIQVLQHNESGQSLLKKKLDERVDWPFISDDKKGTTVVFKGAAKDKFLRNLGCPNDLSR